MIVLPDDLPISLTPFTFLLGTWTGSGVVSYPVGQSKATEVNFFQVCQFTALENGKLEYRSTFSDSEGIIISQEHGYWLLAKPSGEHDPGPGLLPGTGKPIIETREELESMRNENGGFDIEAIISNSDSVSELYFGQIKGARVDIATDAVLRSPNTKDYSAGVRMFGLVEGALLWAWDMAAIGSPLKSHASARLVKKDD
mgnify:FL=1